MDDDGSQELEFTGDVTDYWSYTQVRDWVLLLSDMTRTALHLYLLLRSMLTEKRAGGLRRMSLDQLCWLLPGVNGKPASLTMVKDALRLLEVHNLVVNPDGARLVTSGGKNAIQNAFRKYKVNDLPPDAYTGWRNVWDKLDAYTPDWRESPPQPPTHLRTEHGVSRKNDPRSDQRQNDEAAARFESRFSDASSRKSDRAGRKTDSTRRKNGATPPLTSENAPPKEAPQRSSSLSGDPSAPADRSVSVEAETTRENAAPQNDNEPASPEPTDVGETAVPVPAQRPDGAQVGLSAVEQVLAVYEEALGGTALDRGKLLAAAELLLAARPLWWVMDRARELPKWGDDLVKHAGKSKVPFAKPQPPAGPQNPCPSHPRLEAAGCPQCSAEDAIDRQRRELDAQRGIDDASARQALAALIAGRGQRKSKAERTREAALRQAELARQQSAERAEHLRALEHQGA